MNRGISHADIFTDDRDRRVFLEELSSACELAKDRLDHFAAYWRQIGSKGLRGVWLPGFALLLAAVPVAARTATDAPPATTHAGARLAGLAVVQQTTDYTCGPAVAVGVARYLGVEVDELVVAREMGTSPAKGTNPQQMAGWFIAKGFKVRWGENGSLDLLRANLAKGIPTLVEWIDWGGHWVVVVGIDDKGTAQTDDDDIIFADPWDRIDGVADGLTRFNLERFDSMWFDAFLFHRPMRRVYISVER